MAKSALKLRAQKLRKKGLSIGDIAERLGVSKSSASAWCAGVPLTAAQQRRITERAVRAGHAGRLAGAAANRDKRLAAIAGFAAEGRTQTEQLTDRELLLVGAALYWGEGSKVGQLSFVNSDMGMVLFMYRWFQRALGIRKEDFFPRVYISDLHVRRRHEIEEYWSRLLDIPIAQFRSTVVLKRPRKKRYPDHARYYGLLSLRLRNSTYVKYRILGLIEGLKCSTF